MSMHLDAPRNDTLALVVDLEQSNTYDEGIVLAVARALWDQFNIELDCDYLVVEMVWCNGREEVAKRPPQAPESQTD